MDCEEGKLVYTSIEFVFTLQSVTNVTFYSTFHGPYYSIFQEHGHVMFSSKARKKILCYYYEATEWGPVCGV